MKTAIQTCLSYDAEPRPSGARLPSCTFILPCLNEAESLLTVLQTIEKVRTYFELLEVIVVDNGSDDGSADRARAFGARVVHCEKRGYGAALRAGIASAKNDLVLFADADNTYDWFESVTLVHTLLDRKADLVVGNRLGERLESRAMPFLNRRFGTPALSFLITLLFGSGAVVRDCNGGMRTFSKSKFTEWGAQANGMEFASEMIIRALINGARYVEVPISYRRSAPNRRSHLRRWNDGYRHLREILSVYCRG